MSSPSARLPTVSVHVHCTACGGRGTLGGMVCHCRTDDLVKALTDTVDALSQLATSLQPGSPAQQLADEAGFKGSAMLASVGK